jgi:osmotically-inducible protein OsmY
LATDARLQGIAVTIVEEDNSLRLRGIVPSEEIHQIIHELATHTLGIDAVVDELAVVAPQTAPSPENPSPQ